MKEKNTFWAERELDLEIRNPDRAFDSARTYEEDDGSWWTDEK